MNTYYFADEYVFICHRIRFHLPSKTFSFAIEDALHENRSLDNGISPLLMTDCCNWMALYFIKYFLPPLMTIPFLTFLMSEPA